MKFKSLQTRICFTAGLCLFISSASLVLYGVFSAAANEKYVTAEVSTLIEDSTIREVQNLAQSRANSIQAKLQNALDSARTLASAFAASKAEQSPLSLGREQQQEMMCSQEGGAPSFSKGVAGLTPSTWAKVAMIRCSIVCCSSQTTQVATVLTA